IFITGPWTIVTLTRDTDTRYITLAQQEDGQWILIVCVSQGSGILESRQREGSYIGIPKKGWQAGTFNKSDRWIMNKRLLFLTQIVYCIRSPR
ncbi:hypothetical protein P5673_000037, partial [Acropora cervicornis]